MLKQPKQLVNSREQVSIMCGFFLNLTLINKGILMSDFTNTNEIRFERILNINKFLLKLNIT